MNIKPLRTKRDYKAALKIASAYFDDPPARGSVEADQFEVLVMLIEDYEKTHYPVDPPDPIEAIKFRMEQEGLTVQDLV